MSSLVATALTDGMARIRGGVFRMGADDGYFEEAPAHMVLSLIHI